MSQLLSTRVRRAVVAAVLSAIPVLGLTAVTAHASTVTRLNVPTDLPTIGTNGIGMFFGESCTSAGNCVAVGQDDSSGKPIYANETNGTWTPPVDLTVQGTWGVLLAVSCSSLGNCVAVGKDDSVNSNVPYYVTEVGGTWGAPVDLPLGGIYANLESVSCPSDGQCTVIGLNVVTNLPFSISVDNGTWSAPTNISFAANSTHIGVLYSVSCVSEGNCVAVGYAFDTDQPTYAVEAGGTWGTMNLWHVTGQFNAVSCNSMTECLAVGQDSTTNKPWYAAEVGGVWVSAPTDLTTVGAEGTLSGVSCTSPGNCEAVGTDDASQQEPLVVGEVNGSFGAVADLATPTGILDAVSCSSPGSCSAVGNDARPMAVAETSGTWGITSDDDTVGASGHGQFVSVSCPSNGDCVAVGQDLETNATVIDEETSGTWGTPVEGSSTSGDTFESVSCPSVGNCTAVGYEPGNSSPEEPIVQSETNGQWGALLVGPNNGTTGTFTGVSCWSPGDCIAVGEDTTNSKLLYDVETNGTWAASVDVPSPNGTGALNAVSCPSSGNCTAVGIDNGSQDPLVLSEVNGVWGTPTDQIYVSPSTFVRATGTWQFDGVSCASAGNCVAVGYGTNGSIQSTEKNGSWIGPFGLVLKTGSSDWIASGVSCPAVGDCVVTGTDYVDVGPIGEASSFEITVANGAWQSGVAIDGASNLESAMVAVSCPSIGACLLVGKDVGNSQPEIDAYATAQPALSIANATTLGTTGTSVNVVVSGGSAGSTAQFSVTGTGCSMVGSSLTASGADRCVVSAVTAANGFFASTTATPVTFTFTLAKQATLKVAAKSSRGIVKLAATGGSGSGAVTFKVSGKGCVLHGNRLTAPKSAHCSVTAHKAARGIYAAASSRSQLVVFAK